MLLSLNWLKKYLETKKNLDPNELAEKLTLATVEVENFSVINNFTNIVVGQIKEIINHPKADKLKLCQVDVGQDKYLQIVCGGQNLYQEMKVAVALVGSQVFWHGQTPQPIVKIKIRGIESEGMICSASEIGLENYFAKDDIVDLKDYQAKNAAPLAEVLAIQDIVMEIDNKSLTNRPDLWGHYGLAREIAALFNLKFKELKLEKIITDHKKALNITIENPVDCPRYFGVVLDNIKIAPSPHWLKNRLLAVDQRPINNVVDITNFIMLELGQPLHAFDWVKVKGSKIIIKRANNQQSYTTLDGVKRTLTDNILTINDAENVIALAGIIGGLNSEINEKTTTIIIESANFEPNLIRRGSTYLSLRTEASSRFEKGLDPALTELAINRAINLLQEIIPEAKIVSNLVEAGDYKATERTIKITEEYINKKIGNVIPLKTAAAILNNLSFGVKNKNKLLQVTVPSFRAGRDINTPEDLVEEISRIYGYNNLQPKLPSLTLDFPEINWERKLERRLKNMLTLGLNFSEVYNYAMVSEDLINKLKLDIDEFFQLKNYLSADQKYLRINLIINLLKNIQHNLKYFTSFRIFEIGRVFKKKPGKDFRDPDKNYPLPQQQKHLAGLIVGEPEVFLAAKGAMTDLLEKLNIKYQLQADEDFHPWAAKGTTLKMLINDQILGAVGLVATEVLNNLDIGKPVAFFNLNFTKFAKITGPEKKFNSLNKFPEVIKDLSIIVAENVKWSEIEAMVINSSSLITAIELFDIYQAKSLGEGKKSLAFHLTFYHPERTLVSNEVEQEMQKIMNNLEKKFKVIIRKA